MLAASDTGDRNFNLQEHVVVIDDTTASSAEPLFLDTTQAKTAAIFLQDACLRHHYIRSRDTTAIVERPDRLRAVNLGLAAAIARIDDALSTHPDPTQESSSSGSESGEDDLAAALGRMNLATHPLELRKSPVAIVRSSASIDIFNHAAVKFVHGDIDGDVYLENLKAWVSNSQDKISQGLSEIPDGLSQGDLYRTCVLLNLEANF